MISLYSLGVLLYIAAYKEEDPSKKKRLQTLAMILPRASDPSLYVVEALLGCVDFVLKDDWKKLLRLTKGGYFRNIDTQEVECMYDNTVELGNWLRYSWKRTLKGTLRDECLDVKGFELQLSY
jgi:hypothetical protein